MALLRGFDISAYQSSAAPSADFVIVKATEGKAYASSRFAAQWRSAKTSAKHRGAYHFARPEQSSAASQAARFLDVVQPVPGESVWLDLEASDLSQAGTNVWARAWGDYVREHAPGVTSGVYMGSGYAGNGTGRDLAEHFRWWWYPQYPSAARTSTWPTSFSPWLPYGLTCGWSRPHIWQWTANFGGLDANVSPLTLDQLAGGGQTPQEDIMLSGSIPAGPGPFAPILCSGNKHLYLGFDNTLVLDAPPVTRQAPARFRVAMHQSGRKGVVETVTVGAALDDTKGWADNVGLTLPAGCDRIDIVRLDDGGRPVGFCVI